MKSTPQTSAVFRVGLPLLLAGLVVLAGCSRQAETDEASAPAVRAVGSIVPVQTFIRRVGGDGVRADVLVPPGASPHSYEPTAKQMARLAEADVFFRVGAPFEDALLPRLRKTFPQLKIVDLREGLKLLPMQGHDQDHDHDHGHAHGPTDPHVWMDPLAVRTMAETIAVSLSELDGQTDGRVYRHNLQAFQHDIDAVHAELTNTLRPYRGRTLLVFHPAFGYFAHRYGLKQRAIEVDGKQPSAKQLATILDQARKLDARVIFVQPQFPEDSARRLARTLGSAVVPMDPLAGDYLANLRRMAGQMAEALSAPAADGQP